MIILDLDGQTWYVCEIGFHMTMVVDTTDFLKLLDRNRDVHETECG